MTAGSPLRILMVAPQSFFRPRGTPFSVLYGLRAFCKRGRQVELVSYPFGEDVQIPGHDEACFFSGVLCRKHRLVHVYDMHSSLPQQLTHDESWNLAPFRHLFESLERSVLTPCDGVLTTCQDLAEQALRCCVAFVSRQSQGSGRP